MEVVGPILGGLVVVGAFVLMVSAMADGAVQDERRVAAENEVRTVTAARTVASRSALPSAEPTFATIVVPTVRPRPSLRTLPKLTEPEAVAMVMPSVVHIYASKGSGTGFVVRAGLIATNRHVVEGTDRVIVESVTGVQQAGKVSYVSPREDIALISAQGFGSPAVRIGEVDDLRAGDVVVAIGYAGGVGDRFNGPPTISRGLFSALRTLDGIPYVQSGAALNPGNSGGPLLALTGEVIGMNTLGARGLNEVFYAVPMTSVVAAIGP